MDYNPIGEFRVLHSVDFPNMENQEEDKIILVKIVETRPVKGCWEPGEHLGLRAEDDTGTSYFCNWDVYDDASMSPTWHWWAKDTRQSWFDICQGMPRIPFRPSFLGRLGNVLNYCDQHQRLDYKARVESKAYAAVAIEEGFDSPPACFDCLLKKPAITEPKKNTWNGWR